MMKSVYSTITRKKKISGTPRYIPQSINQKKYVNLLENDKVPIVLGIGPAGCGKTLFACLSAINELMSGNIQKVILTRPIVCVEDEELGFLPGNIHRKMDPWTRPIFDIFTEFYDQKDIDIMVNSGIIEVSPLAYMRGRTFKNSFIIADEMQNSTPNQMLMLTTRVGENTKLVITGDLKQSDRCMSNGLLDIIQKVENYPISVNESMVQMVEMDHTDIRRSMVVSQILSMYETKHSVTDTIVYTDDTNSTNSPPLPLKKNIHTSNNDAALIPISQYKQLNL